MIDEQLQRLSRISTMWNLVKQAHHVDESAAQTAQQVLLERYVGAVHRYLLGAVRDEDAADELLQVFAVRFLEGRFRRADPERGRFRKFLKTALINLVNDHFNQQTRRRRTISSDAVNIEQWGCSADFHDETFLESWRNELIARAWDSLAEIEKTGETPYYTLLKMHAEYPELRSVQLAGRLAEQLQLESSPTDVAVRKMLQRARYTLVDLVLDEVAHSLGGANLDEIEEEVIDIGLMRYCQAAIDRRRGTSSFP